MPQHQMLQRFLRFIKDQHLFAADSGLVLAVSGGVDSVVLVDLCIKAKLKPVIAHMNFNLRGKESERDEQFVKALATRAGLPLYIKTVDTTAYASANHLSIQVAARQLRYEWFETLRLEIISATHATGSARAAYVVTAHHMDDSVETMLMNLMRGTGIVGLRGILPKQQFIIRPLLCFTKDEILAYASDHDLRWVEDSSNQVDKYTRNYFRNQLIPMLANIFPEVKDNLYHNLGRFNDAAILYREAVDRSIRKLVERKENELHIPILKLKKMIAPQTLLFEILQPFGFTSGEVDQVWKLLDSETGKQVKSSSHRVIKNRNWLIIAAASQKDAAHIVIEADDQSVIFENGQLTIARHERSSMHFRDDNPLIPRDSSAAIAYLDAKKLAFPLLLRKWKPGDYFYPLGMKKKKKIARFLIDARLSKTQKENIRVIESEKKIVWVVGMRIDDRLKLTDATRDVIMITLQPAPGNE